MSIIYFLKVRCVGLNMNSLFPPGECYKTVKTIKVKVRTLQLEFCSIAVSGYDEDQIT